MDKWRQWAIIAAIGAVAIFIGWNAAFAATLKGVVDTNGDQFPDYFVFDKEGVEMVCYSKQTNQMFTAYCKDNLGIVHLFEAVPESEGWLKDIEETN